MRDVASKRLDEDPAQFHLGIWTACDVLLDDDEGWIG